MIRRPGFWGGALALLSLLSLLAVFSASSSAIEAQLKAVEAGLRSFLLDWYAWRLEPPGSERRASLWERSRASMNTVLSSPLWKPLGPQKRFDSTQRDALAALWDQHDREAAPASESALDQACRRLLAQVQALEAVQGGTDSALRQLLWASVTGALVLVGLLMFYQGRQRDLSDRLRQLNRSSLAVLEEERKSLSRDLHDTVAQDLAAAKILLSQASLEPALGTRIRQNLDSALAAVRSLATGLRPPSLDRIGLVDALRELCEGAQKRTSMNVVCEVPSAPTVSLDVDRSLHLYRIVQEALQNALLHSRGTEVRVSAVQIAGRFVLEVRDDGQGLDPDAVERARERGRIGLTGMQERALVADARLSFEALPGCGTLVHLEVTV